MEVTLSPADATDLPILAEMNRLVYMREAISMIAFKNWPAETNMFNFFQSRIKQLMETPNAYIFKATSETGEIVGFISCTLVHEKGGVEAGAKAPSPESNGPTSKAMGQMEDIFNMEFIKGWAPVMESMKDLINGMKHYFLSTFVVTPKYQGKGIGSKLLGRCLEIADKDGLPTWLSALPGSHNLYLRFGFGDVGHNDVDLNKWDHHRFRGFGIYRQYSMMRQPKISN
ncbi:acyl-CoA N-acyltransferase [Hyaloscypha finlandica]|nr:acyl-CoA N-acyltransferase [Hyaloscypha finlandica]KAH8809885.1 acyl-CoA N-acyltransferase [Hyaloscypha sp. PMI_1271]